MLEYIGIGASLLVLLSMCFKTSTYKATMAMRCINLIGSGIFAMYGFLLPAYSTAFLNVMLVLVDIYHIIKLVKEHKNGGM